MNTKRYKLILTNRNSQFTATLVGEDLHTLSTNDSVLLERWLHVFFEYEMWLTEDVTREVNDLVDSLTCSKNMTIYRDY